MKLDHGFIMQLYYGIHNMQFLGYSLDDVANVKS